MPQMQLIDKNPMVREIVEACVRYCVECETIQDGRKSDIRNALEEIRSSALQIAYDLKLDSIH